MREAFFLPDQSAYIAGFASPKIKQTPIDSSFTGKQSGRLILGQRRETPCPARAQRLQPAQVGIVYVDEIDKVCSEGERGSSSFRRPPRGLFSST